MRLPVVNDLLERLEAAMDERARVIEGSGYQGWLTCLRPDGSMHYTTAGSQPLDEPHWVIDGKEAVGYASAQIVHDEKREWFQFCACGHQWLFHDIGEPAADDHLCCVEGCDQKACPGRQSRDEMQVVS